MLKCIAKLDKLEAWETDYYITIKGLDQNITVSKQDFFILEKLLHKVIKGFLSGN